MQIGNAGEIPNHWYALIRGNFDSNSILTEHPPTEDVLGSRERSDWLRLNVLPRIVVIWTSENDCQQEFDSYFEWDLIASPQTNEWNVFKFPGLRPIEHRIINRSIGNLTTLDYHHPWWDFIEAIDQSVLESEQNYHRIRQSIN